MDGWTLPAGEHLPAAWPGTGEGRRGRGEAAIRDGGWNAVLPPGGSTVTGFSGSWTHPQPAPAAITPNGRPCRVKVW